MKNFRIFRWLVFGGIFLGVFFILNARLLADEPSIFLADEVVITASGYEELLEKSATSVTVLKVEKLKKQGLNYLSQALAQVGGTDLKSYGSLGAQATISLRGSRSEQVLVLLDGQKINSSQNGTFDFGAIPLDDLERIEVIKFPLSALYGADALGGVVNLISRKPQKRKGEVNFLAGSFRERKYQLDYCDSSGVVGYKVNLNLLDSDGFRKNSDFHGKNYSFKFDLPKNFLGASASYFYQKSNRGVPGSLVYPSETARQNDEGNLFSLGTDFSFLGGIENKTNFYFNQYQQDYSDPVWFSFSEHKNKNYGVDYLSNFSLFENQTFLACLSYRQESVLSSDVGEHSRNNAAVIVQDDIELLENLGMIFSSRFERFSTFGKIFTPRIGARWRSSPDLNFKASRIQGFRAPTFNELYWPESFWAGGNPNLKPEVGEAYDFELCWHPELGEIKLGGFTGKTFNLINWAADAVGVWRPQNLAAVNRDGLELGIIVPCGFGEFTSNFSWHNVTDISTRREVTYQPHYKANVGVHLKNKGETFGAYFGWRYVGWRYATNTDFSQRILPSYQLVDLKVYIKLDSWILRAGIDNIFDEQYQEIADYPAAGRSFWASTGVEF